MYQHDEIKYLDKLYGTMPVTTEGYFYNTRPIRCSIKLSPSTIEFSLLFLDRLFFHIENSGGIILVSMDEDNIPQLIAQFENREISFGIRETQNTEQLKAQETFLDKESNGYRIVSKIDTVVTSRVKFSYHRDFDHRYINLNQKRPIEDQAFAICKIIRSHTTT